MSASLKRRLLAAVCSASFASFAVGPAVTEADTPQPVIWCAANLGSDTESTSDSVIATTLREVRSSASPASDSVVFTLDMRRPGPEISIVETRDGGGPRQLYLTVREPDRGDAEVAPLRALPKRTSSSDANVSLVGNVGKGSFVPLTWVTRGTRIVLLSPPGVLSGVQIRAIRSAMSNGERPTQ